MVAMAAIVKPFRVVCLHEGHVVDPERIFRGKRPQASLSTQAGVFSRVVGLKVPLVKAAPKRFFRASALPEDDLVAETTPVIQEPLQVEHTSAGEPDFEGPTVKVKFELQRECHFGQQFKVVGSDPQFGNWDPSAAVPLNWSEGHLWTADLDVPEGKKIEYKYILVSDQEETVEWQPGSNGVLETVAGAGPLLLSEPWEEPQPESIDDVDAQPAGEEPVSDDIEASSPADAVADVVASAAAGALNAGLTAAKAVEGTVDSVSSNGKTNGVADKKEGASTGVEIPVVDAALAATAEPAKSAAPPAESAAPPAESAAPPSKFAAPPSKPAAPPSKPAAPPSKPAAPPAKEVRGTSTKTQKTTSNDA
ncbi:uncharacterized protein [Physcomitrium patens]|uniref:CBM20 domain-containing protein n=1 Tax=Physcomitrium patens TaxID=3218 RepID=A0A2K1KGR6_PHYPA|nr:uncharacterized protein LOC112283652 [Physcomitrium patens]PNR52974.1 hypothetical protein PHYPA_009349 [Physcomitrium patens]|eukprot:XP_024378449.1 uncharacterized protein LOC112283652 [Physcomitrella patens]